MHILGSFFFFLLCFSFPSSVTLQGLVHNGSLSSLYFIFIICPYRIFFSVFKLMPPPSTLFLLLPPLVIYIRMCVCSFAPFLTFIPPPPICLSALPVWLCGSQGGLYISWNLSLPPGLDWHGMRNTYEAHNMPVIHRHTPLLGLYTILTFTLLCFSYF